MAKLKDNDIKKKIRATYGEYQIINPEFNIDILQELSEMIRNNSTVVSEDEISDVQINNTVKIMRYLLKNLTNIEEEWDSIDDIRLEEMLNHANGDFKQVVSSLMDIMLEIAHDNVINDIRKLSILNDKLVEFKESMVNTTKMEQTLKSLGLDMEKLTKIQQGDEIAIKEFQDSIVKELEKQNKPKRKYTKRK